MRESDVTTDLIAALVKARPAFKTVAKTKTAKVLMKTGGTYVYHYADLADVNEATVEPLAQNGLVITQPVDWESELNANVVRTRLSHVSGQFMESRYPIRSYERPQEEGGEITYARRYALSAMLGIAAEEDDDAQAAQAAKPVEVKAAEAKAAHARLAAAQDKPAAAEPAPSRHAGQKTITEQQQKRLFAIAKGAGWTADDIKLVLKSKWNLEHTKDINWSAYDSICAFFKVPPEKVMEEDFRAEQAAEDDVEYRQREAEDNATRHAKPSPAPADDMPF